MYHLLLTDTKTTKEGFVKDTAIVPGCNNEIQTLAPIDTPSHSHTARTHACTYLCTFHKVIILNDLLLQRFVSMAFLTLILITFLIGIDEMSSYSTKIYITGNSPSRKRTDCMLKS